MTDAKKKRKNEWWSPLLCSRPAAFPFFKTACVPINLCNPPPMILSPSSFQLIWSHKTCRIPQIQALKATCCLCLAVITVFSCLLLLCLCLFNDHMTYCLFMVFKYRLILLVCLLWLIFNKIWPYTCVLLCAFHDSLMLPDLYLFIYFCAMTKISDYADIL